MRHAATAENRSKWLTFVEKVERPRHRADLGKIALVFGELAGALGEWRETVKEIDMKDSQVVLEWVADAREKERVTTRREDVLRLAEKRFKSELTAEDRQMISTQESAAVLGAWLDAVVEQPTSADFRAVLRR